MCVYKLPKLIPRVYVLAFMFLCFLVGFCSCGVIMWSVPKQKQTEAQFTIRPYEGCKSTPYPFNQPAEVNPQNYEFRPRFLGKPIKIFGK